MTNLDEIDRNAVKEDALNVSTATAKTNYNNYITVRLVDILRSDYSIIRYVVNKINFLIYLSRIHIRFWPGLIE